MLIPSGVAAALWVLAASASPPSVLVLPVENKEGVSRDLAELVTVSVASLASRDGRFRVRSFREVEGTMTQEQVRQAAGCDSAGCAAEIAGALNADEIIMGTLGRVGATYVLAMTRLRARDAQVLGRALARFPVGQEESILDGLSALVAELMGAPPPAPRSAPPASAQPAAPMATAPRPAVARAATPPVAPPPQGSTPSATPPGRPSSALAPTAGRARKEAPLPRSGTAANQAVPRTRDGDAGGGPSLVQVGFWVGGGSASAAAGVVTLLALLCGGVAASISLYDLAGRGFDMGNRQHVIPFGLAVFSNIMLASTGVLGAMAVPLLLLGVVVLGASLVTP